jgi:tetratricopeptide (TPR) repeat protein
MALRYYQRSLPACRRVFGPEHDETLAAMNGMASALSLAGRFDEAVALQYERIEILRRTRGPAHHDTRAAVSDLAAVLIDQRRLAEAERLLRLDLEALQRDDPNDPVTLKARSDLIGVLTDEHKHEEAATLGKTNLAECLRVLGFQHPTTQSEVIRLGWSLLNLRRYEESRAFYQEVFERSRRELGPEAPFTRDIREALAGTLVGLGRFADAETLIRQEIEAAERERGPAHAAVFVRMIKRALILREMGRADEARDVLGSVVERASQALSPERRGRLDPFTARGVELNGARAEVMLRGRDRSGQPGHLLPASPAPPVIEAPFRAVAPVADGRLGTGEYGAPFEVTFTDDGNPGILWLFDSRLPDKTKTPDDLSFRIFAAHTATSLYVAFEVRDQYVRAEESDGSAPWFNDSIELFLDGDQVANDYVPIAVGSQGTREGFHLVADALGHRYTFAGDLTNDDWRAVAGRTEGGYVIEFEIPLSLIDTQDGPGKRPAATGSTLFINACVNDNDTSLSKQSYFGMLWSDHPWVKPNIGGEDFWPVRLRLTP